MNKDQIIDKLRQLAEAFVGETFYDRKSGNERSALHIILSDSMQASHFVTLIESEFEIEFDDEEVDFDFFKSFDHISELVCNHIQGSKSSGNTCG